MTQRRLTLLLVLFFLALAIPSSVLVYQAYAQLKWEAFYQHQRLARELTLRIDADFRDLIEREENRPISDYEFLNVTGSGDTAFLQRSPLSEFPAQTDVPGLLGYFQVDASGQLRTPLVPEADAREYGISSSELERREQQEGRIRDILDRNRLVEKSDFAGAPAAVPAPLVEAEEEGFFSRRDSGAMLKSEIGISSAIESDEAYFRSGQSAFDELTSRKLKAPGESSERAQQLENLKLEDRYQVAKQAAPEGAASADQKQGENRRLRKEEVNLPQTVQEQQAKLQTGLDAPDDADLRASEPLLQRRRAVRIETFVSEVEPMEFALLDSGHFVLFRRVWHNDERYVQGILFDQARFIERLIAPAFRESSLSSMSRMIVAYRGAILERFSPAYGREYRPGPEQQIDELLYQGRLIAPFGDLELIFTLARLPIGAGGQVVIWSALVLVLVLIGGTLMLLRLGQRQLALTRQQQDFVSAVSHELKTPLTSIRMYGEMLRAGWADEAKRKSYYDFIYHEAERLTRLINNVLQLARMSRNEQQASLQTLSVSDVLRELRPRLESQLEPTGFVLEMSGEAELGAARIDIDPDWFIQIFINLVDNAVKFSAAADNKIIELRCQALSDDRLQFALRDHGPGIRPDQMKKIFQLFYRSENELTRETVGTGIGLALVQQLARAMQAEVDVVNCDPGAEFRLRFATSGG